MSQWEKPKEWLERSVVCVMNLFQKFTRAELQPWTDPDPLSLCREQRQKEAPKTAVVNSFPKDRDYRQEAMQAAGGVTGMSKYQSVRSN